MTSSGSNNVSSSSSRVSKKIDINKNNFERMLTARSGPLGVGRLPRTLGPAEGSDHLFLLPERALVMDSTQLKQDLAGLDFNLHFNRLHTAPRGNVWLCEFFFLFFSINLTKKILLYF